MTPVGHTLTGLTIAVLATPREWSLHSRVSTMAAIVLLANAPDFPFPGWGHDRYHISHSIIVTTVGVLVVGLVVRLLVGARTLPLRLYVAGGLAWYSHLLLDTMYNYDKGLAMYWPLSPGRLSLAVPWFSVMDRHHLWSTHNLQVWAIEAAVYGTVFAAVCYGRYLTRPKKTPVAL